MSNEGVIKPGWSQSSWDQARQAIVQQSRLTRALSGVRDAYWLASDHSLDGEFAHLYLLLQVNLGINAPTMAMLRTVFDMLPREILGAGIAFGFDAPSVRDQMQVFVRENIVAIKKLTKAK